MRSVFPKRQETWKLLDDTFKEIRKLDEDNEEDPKNKLESDLKTKLESYHEWLKATMYKNFPETRPFVPSAPVNRDISARELRE